MKWCDQCRCFHTPPVSQAGVDGPDCPVLDDLREIARLLDRSTQTGKAPTKDEWAALRLANETLARLGG